MAEEGVLPIFLRTSLIAFLNTLLVTGTAVPQDKPIPIKTITNSIGMELVLIPAGEFVMGSSESKEDLVAKYPDAKPEDFESEYPAHLVRITNPYYLGVHEVTVGQFRKFVDRKTTKRRRRRTAKVVGIGIRKRGIGEQDSKFTWRNAGFEQEKDHPVVNVSWNDARAFCEWLGNKEGRENMTFRRRHSGNTLAVQVQRRLIRLVTILHTSRSTLGGGASSAMVTRKMSSAPIGLV